MTLTEAESQRKGLARANLIRKQCKKIALIKMHIYNDYQSFIFIKSIPQSFLGEYCKLMPGKLILVVLSPNHFQYKSNLTKSIDIYIIYTIMTIN